MNCPAPLQNSENLPPPVIEYCEVEDCGSAIIDVLILLTPEAELWLDDNFGIFGMLYVWTAQVYTNAALYRSNITNKSIRCFVTSFSPDTPHSSIIENDIRGQLQYNHNQIDVLQVQYRPDVIVMITNEGYTEMGTQIEGIAFSGALTHDGQNIYSPKYAIVEVPFLGAPSFVFSHELGHVFGAFHTIDNNATHPVCARAHEFFISGVHKNTIMHVSSNPELENPILNYSNPDVIFYGTPTGVASSNNNVQSMNAYMCTVANEQPSAVLGVIIEGSSLLCGVNGEITTSSLHAAIIPAAPGFPGLPPYTYEWRWNSDGNFSLNNPGTVLSSTSSAITIMSVLNCPHFFLQVKVTSSDNIVAYNQKKISTQLCSPCH